MRQFVTTEDFIFNGQSLPGIPLLVDAECVPVPVVNSYMMHVVLQKGRAHSPHTWQNHCDSLYDYFSWLEVQKLRWDDEPLQRDIGKEVSNLALYQRWCHDTYRKSKRARLRKELVEVKALLQKTDSINAALQLENGRLKALNRKYLNELNRLAGDISRI